MLARYFRAGPLAALLILTCSLAAQAQEISIAAVRALGVGATATVRGVVTRAAGRAVRLQDGTAAIATFQSSGPLFDAVMAGDVATADELLVTGTTSEVNGLFQISPVESFIVVGRGNGLPDPEIVTLSDINANGEAYESEVIQIEDLTLDAAGDTEFQPDRSYNVTDSSSPSGFGIVRVAQATDSRLVGLPIPVNPLVFTGVLGQFGSSDPHTEGYQLIPVDVADLVTQTGTVAGTGTETPAGFALGTAHPNPFGGSAAPSTTLRFTLDAAASVRLSVYDGLGREVAVLTEGTRAAGTHTAVLDANTLPSGVYLVRLMAGTQALARTITLAR